MIFRCSVCRGQFEFEPDLRKDFIFCTHCGAQLQTKKPKKQSAAANAASSALEGEIPTGGFVESYDAAKAEEDELNTPIRPASAGGFPAMAAPSALPIPEFAPPLRSSSSANNANFGIPMGGPPQQQSYDQQPYDQQSYSSPRRPMRRKKKSNGGIIAIIIIGAVILIGGTVTLIFALNQHDEPEPVKTKKAPPPQKDPGELFSNVKTEGTPADAAPERVNDKVNDPNEPNQP